MFFIIALTNLKTMYSFFICFIVLVVSYFVYGKFIEKISGVDETRQTPAFRLQDGVDYIPMSKIKNFLVHFLNIAGLGPIFGAIQGALFGPVAFIWITLGTIFIGGVHDFFSGFMSMRNDGYTMPNIISKSLDRPPMTITMKAVLNKTSDSANCPVTRPPAVIPSISSMPYRKISEKNCINNTPFIVVWTIIMEKRKKYKRAKKKGRILLPGWVISLNQ